MTEAKKNLLLVEDEFLIAMSERVQLEKYGYAVTTVNSGEKAIDAMKGDRFFDLILMDINLGAGIDGTQAAEVILKDHDIPIVFLSSHMEPAIVGKTERITSFGYVVKNSSITVLDASIKMAFKLSSANRKIEHSDAKHRAMISNTSDVIGIIGIDGIMKYKSPNIEKWFGWKPEDLIGTDGWLTVHPDDLGRVQNVFQELLQEDNASKTLEYRYKCKDGGYKPIELAATNLTNDPIIDGVLLNYHDITQRKAAEEALRESEEKYRNLFNKADVGMFRSRLDGSQFLEANDKYLSIIGRTREEAIGKPSLDHWADPVKRDEMVKTIRAEGHVDDLECQLVRGDGRVITCLTSYRFYPDTGIIEGTVIELSGNPAFEAQTGLKNDETFKSLFIHMVEGAAFHRMIFDKKGRPEDYVIVETNPAFEKQLGIGRDDVIGKTSREAYKVDEPPYLDIYARVVSTGESVVFESYHPVLDKYFLISACRPVEGHFATIFQNVTEKKNNEKRLAESEGRLRSLVGDMPVGVLIQGPHSEMLMSNPKALELLGLSEEQLLGKTSFDPDWKVIHEDGSPFPGETHPVPQAIASLAPVRAVIMGVHRPTTDSRVWLLVDAIPHIEEGKLEHVICTFIDISKRKQAEALLRESEEKFRSLYSNAEVGMFRSREDGSGILESNDKFLSILGHTREEVIGKPATILWADPKERDEVIKSLDARGFVKDQECRLVRKDGKVITCITSFKLYPDEGIHEGSIIDITDRKLAEEKVQALLAEKETLVKEINHRVKNNMNVLESLLSLHLDRLREPAAVEAVKDINGKIRSMRLLYEQLSTTGNYQEAQIGSYLSGIVNEAVSVFPDSNRIRPEFDIDDFVLGVKEMTAVGIMFNEIATNAMKYAFQGRDRGRMVLAASKKADRVRISLGDDGVGIPEGINVRTSKGLGMTLIEALAKQLGGSIRIERGGGTTFVLEFDARG